MFFFLPFEKRGIEEDLLLLQKQDKEQIP